MMPLCGHTNLVGRDAIYNKLLDYVSLQYLVHLRLLPAIVLEPRIAVVHGILPFFHDG